MEIATGPILSRLDPRGPYATTTTTVVVVVYNSRFTFGPLFWAHFGGIFGFVSAEFRPFLVSCWV